MLSSAKHPAKQRPSAATRHSTGGGTGELLGQLGNRRPEGCTLTEGWLAQICRPTELLAKLRDLHGRLFAETLLDQRKLKPARHAHMIEHDRRVTCPEPRGQLA